MKHIADEVINISDIIAFVSSEEGSAKGKPGMSVFE